MNGLSDRQENRMSSPIEQQLIDGKCYWDAIGPNWMRLIDRKSMDVIGHYRFQFGHPDHWDATVLVPFEQWAPGSKHTTKRFDAAHEARLWVEQAAVERI